MSNKILIKFVVAFGVLAMLLIFLGVNYVPRISALSSTKENAVDVAKYAGSDYFERHPSTAARPLNNAGSDWIERHPSNYYRNSDWIERHPSTVTKPVNYAGVEVAGADMKIAPMFDTTGAVVSDPTGTLLIANPARDKAVAVTVADMKIAPVFDATGAVVSDATGTLLIASQGMKIAPVFDATGAVVSDPTGTILSMINP